MKKLLGSVAAKSAAVILSFIFAAITAASCFAIAFMGYEGFYLKTFPEIEHEQYEEALYSIAAPIEALEGNESLEYYSKKYNMYYTVTDSETGEQLVGNYTGQSYKARVSYYQAIDLKAFDLEITTGNGETAIISSADKTVDITLYAGNDFAISSRRALILKLYEFMHIWRYWLIFIAVISFVAVCVLLIFIYSAAGHRANGEIKCNFFDKLPFDIVSFAALMWAIFTADTVCELHYNTPAIIISCALLALGYLLALLYTASIATRIKTETLLKNTVIYRAFVLLSKFIKKLWRAVKHYLVGLPLLTKSAAYLAAILAADVLLSLWCINYDSFEGFVILSALNAVAASVFIIISAIQLQRIKLGGEKIAAGDTDYKINTDYMFHEFSDFCESLNNISSGMQAAVNEKTKSERLRTELITNVSHDIKTPLTSIINYVDLIKKEVVKNEKLEEYISVLDRQSVRLKKLIDDLVEASKAQTGNLSVELAECEVGVLLTQTVGEFNERLNAAGLIPVVKVPKEPIKIMADGRRLWRVFENLTGNICKYSQAGTRVYMELSRVGEKAVISFKNISKYELDISGDELTERFVRGDKSRNTEGSGLGLSIARSLTELQGGKMKIAIDGDLFKVTLDFDITEC